MTSLIQNITSKADMLARIEKMNAFGPRLTGNSAHKAFIKYLKD